MATKSKDQYVEIVGIKVETATFCVIGKTPLVLNRLSEKAKRELLFPASRKNAAAKESTLKHDPLAEFRASPYTSDDDATPTLLLMPATAFKSSLRNAALDMPGSTKQQIGRLTFIPGEWVNIFGRPEVMCAVTRMSDIKKTPDVRTRAIIPDWAAMVSVTYAVPLLRKQDVINLFSAAGLTIGVGDWRPEKGAGTYGQYEIVNPDDPRFVEALKHGRKDQIEAMADPEPYDKETEELLSWFDVEVKRRGFKLAA